ncbi:MAG: hypothetical protein ACM3JD_08105 [Rudaea sp.]
MRSPDFDLESAHRYFSADCFNAAWDLIDKSQRTPEEDEELVRLCFASQFHWSKRPDVTDTNRSIGYWQASRVYALLRQAENARRYGRLCFEASRKDGVEPFYLAYACEALARAEAVAGNRNAAQDYIERARLLAEKVDDEEDRKRLLDDLNSIQNALP